MTLESLNNYIENLLPADESGLVESIRYSLLSGGKRIRPMLVLEFAKICGLDENIALPVASSIELIHTYSLIHDDLPCMDDDDLRRGKPTNHVVFGECTATLAGDALQPLAFEVLMGADIPSERKCRCAQILASAAGCHGMCLGQYLDMINEGKALNDVQLTEINTYKTGALISAACQLGVAAACDDDYLIDSAKEFGYLLGLAFQIRDDILDEGEEGKNTYVVLLGKEKCLSKIHELTQKAIKCLDVFNNPAGLIDLANSLENRRI